MPEPNTEPAILHGYAEIAECLNITERQAQHWAEAKLIPTFKNGRKVCAFRKSLLAALAKREAEAMRGGTDE